jgi:SMC interacting uncharacterized protein involved in chromosome segregation
MQGKSKEMEQDLRNKANEIEDLKRTIELKDKQINYLKGKRYTPILHTSYFSIF